MEIDILWGEYLVIVFGFDSCLLNLMDYICFLFCLEFSFQARVNETKPSGLYE